MVGGMVGGPWYGAMEGGIAGGTVVGGHGTGTMEI